MKAVVDKVEDEIVVLVTESEEILEVKKEEIMNEIKENDTLIYKEGRWILDKNETINRLEYIKKLTENMWKE